MRSLTLFANTPEFREPATLRFKEEEKLNLAKRTRLGRIFSQPSGRICSVAIDHFVGYSQKLPPGLRNVPETIREILEVPPDAITMLKGMAKGTWAPYAGKIPLIIQSVCFEADDSVFEMLAEPTEALDLGADAIACAIGVCGPKESDYIRALSGLVREAEKVNLPVIAHIYPRDYHGLPKIVHDPENILWAVRVGIECGADVIKVPYTGDVESFTKIVETSPVPVVAAGGPKTETQEEAYDLIRGAIQAGAQGATIGRNIWGSGNIPQVLSRFMEIIHA